LVSIVCLNADDLVFSEVSSLNADDLNFLPTSIKIVELLYGVGKIDKAIEKLNKKNSLKYHQENC